jgi:ParB family transcriptional regulator, chromosome partitioning protein
MNVASISASALRGSTTLPIDQLRIDEKFNVRKTNRGAQNDFIASIKAIGIQVPLIVRKNGKGYLVTDGGKRLNAAQALVKSGDLTPDAPIPVIITEASDAETRELSLALNLIRVDMHPVDAFRAFSELHVDKKKPLDVEAIAERFGVDAKIVRQRLALGALHDSILNAWRDGEIKEDVARAFTLCPDKKEQARLYTELNAHAAESNFNGTLHANQVKNALRAGEENVGRFLQTITIEAYEARGGKVTRDLFGEDHIVSDRALVVDMVNEKLAETHQALIADGWKWVTEQPKNHWEFGRIERQGEATQEERDRLDALEAKTENEGDQDASDAYDALVAEIEARVTFTAEEKATAGCFVGVAQNGTIAIDYGRTEPVAKNAPDAVTGKQKSPLKNAEKKGPAKLTQVMTDHLNEWKRTALKAALVAHAHGNPLALMLAGIASNLMHPQTKYNWAPTEIINKADAMIDLINPKVMNAALRKAFDAKAYFEGCGKSFCLAAVTETIGADHARKIAGQKRGEIAKFATVNVGKTGWLPKELRTSHYDGPQAKKADKPAKAKAKKSTKAKR